MKNFPVAMDQVAVMDSFGESGEPDELMDKYHLMARDIAAKAKEVMARK